MRPLDVYWWTATLGQSPTRRTGSTARLGRRYLEEVVGLGERAVVGVGPREVVGPDRNALSPGRGAVASVGRAHVPRALGRLDEPELDSPRP